MSAVARCGPELAERVIIPKSDWVIVTEAFRCSAVDPGELEIYAEDRTKKKRTDLLILNGVEDTHVEYLGSNAIQISLPNLVSIKSQRTSFEGYLVEYHYLPHDDPEARRQYKNWIANPTDPQAHQWYEENILNKIIPGMRRKGQN